MSQKIVTISMQNSEGNGFGDPWQILSSTFLKSSVFCYVELTLGTEHGRRADRFEIGHDQFHLLRPTVTPLLRQQDRDIAEEFQFGATEIDPVVPATPVRSVR